MHPTTAMVFAAGLGKRMRPLTEKCPKPLIEVQGRSMLDRALDQLVAAGVKKAVVNTHYLPDMVEKHLNSRTDIEIHVSYEMELLETGGGLKHALNLLGPEPIYVMNSDVVLLDGAAPALNRLANAFDSAKMDVLLLLLEKGKAIGYDGDGDFGLSGDGALTRPEPPRPYVFTGIQLLRPTIVAHEPEKIFSLNRYYFGNPRAHGILHDGAWLHIGTPQGLTEAEAYMKATFRTS